MLKRFFQKLRRKLFVEYLTPDEAWMRLSQTERQQIIDAVCRPLDKAIEKMRNDEFRQKFDTKGGVPC